MYDFDSFEVITKQTSFSHYLQIHFFKKSPKIQNPRYQVTSMSLTTEDTLEICLSDYEVDDEDEDMMSEEDKCPECTKRCPQFTGWNNGEGKQSRNNGKMASQHHHHHGKSRKGSATEREKKE